MGARPSTFRKSGGFLNQVDGTITGYRWTDEFNGQPFTPGKVKGKDGKLKDKFHALYLVPTVRVDGADEDVTTTLFAGAYENYVISEDERTLTSAEEGAEATLGANTAAAKFIASIVEAGFPESNLSDDPNSINIEPMIGTRVRFVQRTDVDATKKLGKRKDPKTGREYDRQDLVVDQVYDLPQVQSKTNGKTQATAPKGKTAAKPAASDVNVEEIAQQLYEEIVGKDDSISRQRFSTQLLMKLMKNPQREAIREAALNLYDENAAA